MGFFDVIYTIFDTIFGWLSDILDSIADVGKNILDLTKYINPFDKDNFIGYKLIVLLSDLLKSLFIPEDGYFENQFNEVKEKLNSKIPYETYLSALSDLENIPSTVDSSSEDSEDVSIDIKDYKLSDNFTITINNFINFGIFNKYKTTWYGWCRAIIYPLLVFYWLNQISKFLNGYNLSDFQTSGKGGDSK